MKRRVPLIRIAVLLIAVATVVGTSTRGSSAQAPSARTAVVLSDLHMGPGRDGVGGWPPVEDFRWGAEFSAFLTEIDREGAGATDLILNGDTFELTSAIDGACASSDPAVGCRESDALARLERVLNGHRDEMTRLGAFARARDNRVVFVPGDADAALLFPGVAKRLVALVGAPDGRVRIASDGYWLSADQRVYAEHGHQIGTGPHRFESWPSPFVRRDGVDHLARPWGEQVTRALYDRYEPDFPAVDNVAALGAGIKPVLAASGVTDAGPSAPDLVRYFLATVSWLQFRLDLDGGDTTSPVWDLARVRADGAAALAAAFPDDDRFKPLLVKALRDGRLDAIVPALTDDELSAVCDYRAAVRRARRRMERVLTQLPGEGPGVVECPRTADTRGSAFEYFWRSRDLAFTTHLDGIRQRLKLTRPVDVFVHGHTHLADRSQATFNMINAAQILTPEGFTPVRGSSSPIAINGGAWQRTISPNQLDELRAEHAISEADLIKSLKIEQLAPCYSFVHVPPYADQPVPAVRYWRQDMAGRWSVAGNCGRQASPPAVAR